MISLEEALVRARLDGRHGHPKDVSLPYLMEHGRWNERERMLVEDAYAEGVLAQQSGYPCHCISCHSFTPAMREKEVQRIRYANGRREQLLAEGMAEGLVARTIEQEIGRGAVLQQHPPTVVRSIKGRL